MPSVHMGAVPLVVTEPLFAGSLSFRHQGPSGTFDALCLPPTPEVPGSNMYSPSMDKDEALLARIGEALSCLGAVRGYIPHPYDMNARIGTICELQDEIITTPSRISLYQSQKPEARMDGLMLEPSEAAVFALGGCGIAIGAGYVAHCGRDSLIDRSALIGKGRSREHFSVVDAIAHLAKRRGVPLEHEPFSLLFALPASCYGHPLDHEEHGDFNRKMLKYAESIDPATAYVQSNEAHLDIGLLAVAQARQHGFGTSHNACPLPGYGSFGHTRRGNPGMRVKRNITIVVRRD